ncbi:MAG: nitroreductase family protein [Desulfobacterium sp.]|nr:nitroreductase family protein [Desulfobacterium sp.]
MNSSLDTLATARRSIRKYVDKEVPESAIREMIALAATAPSPSNQQPVRYVRMVSQDVRHRVFTDMETGYESRVSQAKKLEKPRKAINILNHYRRYSRFMCHAPALFAVGVEKGGASFSKRMNRAGIPMGEALGVMGKDISLGLSLQLFMLGAVEQGLGTCILTAPLHFLDSDNPIVGLENLRVGCFVTLGFPDETPVDPGRKPLAEIYWEA